MNTLTFPVVTAEEFFGIALRALIAQNDGCTKESFIEGALRSGVPKFNPDRLEDFIKALPGFILFEPVFVSTHDCRMFWFVALDRAVMLHLPPGTASV